MKPSDLAPIAVRARKTGETIITHCGCGKDGCTIGEHVWHSTRNMTGGLRASNTDPSSHGWRYEEVTYTDGTSELLPVATGDSTGETATNQPEPIDGAHAEYIRRLLAFERAIDDLELFIAANRPDRLMPTPETASDSEYCSHHLATVGKCEPRNRGDLCRACYDFQLAYGIKPPRELLEARHEGRRWTDQMITAAIHTAKPKSKKKRKGKAS